MVPPPRDDALPLESVRDLLGIVRAMYGTNKSNQPRRQALAMAGREPKRAMELALANAPGTPGHRVAWDLAEGAMRVIGEQYSHSDGLSPTLHHAIYRIRGPYRTRGG